MEYKNGDVVSYRNQEFVVTNDSVNIYKHRRLITVKNIYKPIYYADVQKIDISNIKYLRKINLEEISNFVKNSIVGTSNSKDYISNKTIKKTIYGIVTGDFEFYRGDIILTIIDKNHRQYKFFSRNLFGVYSTHEEYIALSNTLTDYQIF